MDTLPQGQSSKSPAFSFYAKEWLAATLSWALDARGAYATLLAYQWDAGSVPGDDTAALARVLGVTGIKARAVWAVISSKFERCPDGQWRNTRLEQERQKQADRRAALRDNGAKGGRPPKNQTETNRFSQTEPKENQNKSLAFSSSSSFTDDSSKNDESRERPSRHPIQGSGAYEPGSLPRDHMHHVLCGPEMKICLLKWQYEVLARAYNAPENPHGTRAVIAQFIEVLEKGVTPNDSIGPFKWVESEFHTYLKSIGKVAPKIVAAQPKIRPVAELLAEDEARRKARVQ